MPTKQQAFGLTMVVASSSSVISFSLLLHLLLLIVGGPLTLTVVVVHSQAPPMPATTCPTGYVDQGCTLHGILVLFWNFCFYILVNK
jgi:hypothetical protein